MAPHLLEDEKFAIDFIEKNAIEVMESPGFLNLTPHVCVTPLPIARCSYTMTIDAHRGCSIGIESCDS